MAFHRLRAVEAPQVDIAVAQLEVELVPGPVALIVKHEGAAEAECVEPAVCPETRAPPGCLRLGEREVPADSAGPQEAVPLHRNRSLGAGCGESRIVATVRQRAFKVQRDGVARPTCAADRGLAKIRVARALVREGERTRCDIRSQREAHQRKNGVRALLKIGRAWCLSLQGRRNEQASNAERAYGDPWPVNGRHSLASAEAIGFCAAVE